jgi:hypothetical protein
MLVPPTGVHSIGSPQAWWHRVGMRGRSLVPRQRSEGERDRPSR